MTRSQGGAVPSMPEGARLCEVCGAELDLRTPRCLECVTDHHRECWAWERGCLGNRERILFPVPVDGPDPPVPWDPGEALDMEGAALALLQEERALNRLTLFQKGIRFLSVLVPFSLVSLVCATTSSVAGLYLTVVGLFPILALVIQRTLDGIDEVVSYQQARVAREQARLLEQSRRSVPALGRV